MRCSRCQTGNREGLRFCEDCGARLAAPCPSCGAEVTPGKKFCGSCGAALAAAYPEGRFSSPDDVAKAIDLCARSVAIGRERDVLSTLQPASAYLGVAYVVAGRTEEAIARLEEAVAVGESTNSLDAFTVVSLGHAYLAAGRREDAFRCARDGLAKSHQARPSLAATALHLLGDIAARGEPSVPEEATQYYGQALALAQERGMRPLVAHCHLGLGKLYRRTGKHEQAREHLTTATTMYRQMDSRFWLKQAEAELKILG